MWNPLNWFGRKRREQRKWVLHLTATKGVPLNDLIELLARHTPLITQREYSKLPKHLQALFVPTRKA